ncbi:MAG: nucleotide exchange factor GrpE [Actinobacteria bacterium]|nr:nucleotide exchange factor GrpE [Actinomycetota bacterium]
MGHGNQELPPLGPFGEEQEEKRGKIPIRDRRKLYETSEAEEAAEASAAPSPQDAGEEPSAALREAEAKAEAYLQDLQRLKAEFDNFRRRTAKEPGELRQYVAGEIVGRLLGVLDNFQLAVGSAEGSRDFDSMFKGVQMVYRDLQSALEDIGLEPVSARGQLFDPNMHEAVEESEGDGSGVVAVEETLRDGYMFKGAVLRPALVKVTQNAQATEASGA